MFKFIRIMAFALFITITIPTIVSADSEDRIQYETTQESITLNWDLPTDHIELFEGDEKIDFKYENNKKSAIINKLKPDTLYKITIVYYDNDDEVIDFDYLKISTNSNKSKAFNSQNELDDITLDSAYIDGDVKIEWEGNIPNEDDKYTILKDGKKIGTTDTQEFVDENVKEGTDHTYEVATKEKVDDKVLNERLQAAEENDVDLDSQMEEEISYDYYSVNSYIRIPEETVEEHLDDLDTFAKILVRWGIQYTTFIDVDKVGENVPFFPILGGDGRDFDPFSNDYRTRTAIMADFTNDKIKADTTRPGINSKGIDVGESVVYNSDGTVKKRETQDDYTMNFNNYGMTDGTANWEVEHSVGIPIKLLNFASPPAIDYHYTASLSADSASSAWGSISGSHDRAPHHEIVLYTPQSDVGAIIYRFKNEGFYNLFPAPISPERKFSIII